MIEYPSGARYNEHQDVGELVFGFLGPRGRANVFDVGTGIHVRITGRDNRVAVYDYKPWDFELAVRMAARSVFRAPQVMGM